jgi:tetratricopeptide (TPR) repeat protein
MGANMKFFLSHSSADKTHYIKYIADKLGDRAVYDEYTFEAGMDTLEEIFRTLSETDIFVLFISEKSLGSDWVKKEIIQGKSLLDSGQLKRFLPILIDENVSHTDTRIPVWIKDRYNLRLVARPSVALRRITTVFSQLSIERHPLLSARLRLFVGRNTELAEFERRMDDFTKPVPSAVIASGIREVGRKTFLLRALKKTNKIPENYLPITISLQPEDGIEGLISKLYDVGYYPDDFDVVSLADMDMDGKKDLLTKLLVELYKQNEVVLIDDWRSIVRYGGEVADWFIEVCAAVPNNHIVLAIASATRPKLNRRTSTESIFAIRLSELDPEERMGLMIRYLREVEGKHDIDPPRYAPFKSVLNGYPEQAIFAGQLIASEGLPAASLRMHELVEFAALKASVYVERFVSDTARLEFIQFLSWFEFISLDFLTRIEPSVGSPLFAFANELINESICDLIGSSGEYIRMNDIIRDFVSRGSLRVPDKYAQAIQSISADMFRSNDFTEYDYSEKYAAVRVALLDGKAVPENLLIPAHILGAISHKYKTRRFLDVIELSERLLKKANFEKYIENQARHYYCMSLARMRDNRFLTEVQQIRGDEHQYVMGFYYRTMGRYDDALKRYSSISEGRWTENAKREIVLIYNVTEDYDAAFKLAREAYKKYPFDPIVVQAYYEVLRHIPFGDEVVEEMRACLVTVEKLAGERSEEIALCMKANFALYVEGNPKRALQILEEGIGRFSKSAYPLLAKLDVGIAQHDVAILDSALAELHDRELSGQGRVRIKKAEIIRMALAGKKASALSRIDSELGYIFGPARDRFRQRIMSI